MGLGPDAGELLVQHIAGDGVERGEGLVHQQHGGVLGQRAGHGHTLAHSPRQLMDPLAVRAPQPHELQQPLGLGAAPGTGDAPQPQGELDVLTGRQPGEECMLLEHQRRSAAGHLDAAPGGPIQARHQVQQGGLAAAGGTEEADELSGRDGQADVLQHGLGAAGAAEGLGDMVESYGVLNGTECAAGRRLGECRGHPVTSCRVGLLRSPCCGSRCPTAGRGRRRRPWAARRR
jgi:hypothetical protein